MESSLFSGTIRSSQKNIHHLDQSVDIFGSPSHKYFIKEPPTNSTKRKVKKLKIKHYKIKKIKKFYYLKQLQQNDHFLSSIPQLCFV